MDREIVTRGRLPHWYMPGAAHFVTYRLADTVPAAVRKELNAWRDDMLKHTPPGGPSALDYRLQIHKQLFARYDDYLDRHRDVDWLQHPRVASKVRSNLYHHHDSKYHLMAYCIMPNHVHLLLLPTPDLAPAASGHEQEVQGTQAACPTVVGECDDQLSPLAKIMHSLKSYTANEANKVLKREGQFWQKESYDHWVRDDDELERIVNYIRGNPVKAGLVDRHEDWHWSSCHDRFLYDGDASAWLVGHAASGPGVQ